MNSDHCKDSAAFARCIAYSAYVFLKKRLY